MKIIVAAIHGIMTKTTDASWPDRFEAWLLRDAPASGNEFHVEKRKYAAGPFPRWNCWFKDPLIARGLAAELEAVIAGSLEQQGQLPLWIIAHSNGAVIALMTAKILIKRGYKISGMILTGAACDADIKTNGILNWYGDKQLGAAIAYCSEDDEVVAGDARASYPPGSPCWWKARDWAWGKLMKPYGCLGRTGWFWDGQPLSNPKRFGERFIVTDWFKGGHSCYFTPEQSPATFRMFHDEITYAELRFSAVGALAKALSGTQTATNSGGVA